MYNKDFDGKVIRKNGESVNIERYPNYQSVISNYSKKASEPINLTKEKIQECIANYKVIHKINNRVKESNCVIKLDGINGNFGLDIRCAKILLGFDLSRVKISDTALYYEDEDKQTIFILSCFSGDCICSGRLRYEE